MEEQKKTIKNCSNRLIIEKHKMGLSNYAIQKQLRTSPNRVTRVVKHFKQTSQILPESKMGRRVSITEETKQEVHMQTAEDPFETDENLGQQMGISAESVRIICHDGFHFKQQKHVQMMILIMSRREVGQMVISVISRSSDSQNIIELFFFMSFFLTFSKIILRFR